MDDILKDVKIIEDNAQAHGCTFEGVKAGNLCDASGYSFYPGKNVGALGDVGAITTNDEALSNAIRARANYGSSKKYVFKYCGRNGHLDEIRTSVLKVKVNHIDDDNKYRQAIAKFYYENIKKPLNKQECYSDWNSISLQITEKIHEQELSLLISPVLTLEEAKVVVDALNKFNV